MKPITAEVSAELTARGLRLNNDTDDNTGEYATLSNGAQVWVSRVIVNPLSKSIRYDRKSKDFGYYLNNEIVGYAPTYLQAEATLNQLVYGILESQSTAAIDELTVEEVDEAVDFQAQAQAARNAKNDNQPDLPSFEIKWKRTPRARIVTTVRREGIDAATTEADFVKDELPITGVVISCIPCSDYDWMNEQVFADDIDEAAMLAAEVAVDFTILIESAEDIRRAELDSDDCADHADYEKWLADQELAESQRLDELAAELDRLAEQRDADYGRRLNEDIAAFNPQAIQINAALALVQDMIDRHDYSAFQPTPPQPAALTQAATALVDAATFDNIDGEAWEATHGAALAVQALIAPQPTARETQIRRIAEAATSCCSQFPRQVRAIDKAVNLLLDKRLWSWDGEILVVFGSSDDPYRVSEYGCQCKAWESNNPCKHREAWRLLRLVEEGVAA